MPPRSRHAVDPSLMAQANQGQQWQPMPPPGSNQPVQQDNPTFAPGYGSQQPTYGASYGQQQPYVDPRGPQLHQVDDRRAPAPTGPYAPPQQQHVPAPHGSHLRAQPEPAPAAYNYPPENHIPPPPHSAGPALTGPRIRIDPSQMPDPVEGQELDQNLYDDEDFHSCDTKGLIPLAVTDYRGVDQGNSLPRHIRATLPTVPSTHQLLDTSALPFGLVVQPFAPLRYDEAPVPLVSNWVSGQSAFDPPPTPSGPEDIGPPRCDKCRGYINPWVRFIDGGRKWVCNLCGADNTVSHSYFAQLSTMGQRVDHNERPELQHGTVDFLAPREYWFPQPANSVFEDSHDPLAHAGDALATTGSDLLGALQSSLGQTPSRGNTPQPGHRRKHKEVGRRLRRPVPLGRVFVIDVSAGSAQRGIVRSVCEGIHYALYGDKKEGEEEDEEVIGQGERVAFVTVGQSVGFWSLGAALPQPQLLIVSDLEDMFCPMVGGFLVDSQESKTQIEALLTLIPNMYEQQPDGPSCAIGAAIKGTMDGLRSIGGQINFFLSGLPQLGPGKLESRDESSLAGTDKEKQLFSPADPFWRLTADELAEIGIGVNTFVFPERAMDLASVSALSAVTGGDTFFHPKYSPVRDRDSLHDEIKRVVTREVAYNVLVRVRCSNGLRVSDHTGNFFQRSMTDLEFGTMDEAKAFVATMKHEGHRLDDRQMAYVQVAVLYTSSSGERRVRLLNLSLRITGLIGNVFRYADFDASVTMFYKEAVTQLPVKRLKDIRRQLIERCNRVLLMYRKHCAPAVQSGQLILPEGFKMLPIFTLCMVKAKPLKGGNVVADVRAHYLRVAKGAGATAIMSSLYPRIMAVHDLDEKYGFPGPNGRLRLPRFMRASHVWMVSEGAYLLSNGEIAMLWFGGAVSPPIINDLYGVENADELDVRITRLPKLPTLLSTQVRNILTHLERLAGHELPVLLVRQDRDGLEIEFANMLVEDSNNDALSYTDFLMSAHKAITNELSGKSDGWRAPWA
ncbi:hypothetical protein CspeluHIS016_0300470 [Cutaneotrichosporon spelunceum]|uniref:Beta-sandwich domain of Sec23/24 n=1 Tax=Cutaneotrichosporon spelunceum TaxID=1672016 RepID=A0AAD3TST3_9TREE|nr:hypothetical protein CspeluHIS016_0300470 [Cutaneotrichosporon spelunceum]